MKKILAVLIALMLTALCCFAAVAEGTIDFSGYTLEELLTIRDDLTDEIASRPGGEKMVLGTGQYKIGEDLETVMFREPITTSTKVNPCTNTTLIVSGSVTCPV